MHSPLVHLVQECKRQITKYRPWTIADLPLGIRCRILVWSCDTKAFGNLLLTCRAFAMLASSDLREALVQRLVHQTEIKLDHSHTICWQLDNKVKHGPYTRFIDHREAGE